MKCIHCEVETENIVNGEHVCSECVNKLYVPCEYCGELHEKEEMTATNIGYVCSECLEGDFICCNDCGAWIHVDDSYTVRRNREGSEVYVCEQCCK